MSEPSERSTPERARPIAVPVAVVEPIRGRSWAWILPIAAIALVAYLGVHTWRGQGTVITVRALEGHGLKSGDPLRYRGITVGDVTGVLLAPDLSSVDFSVRLDPAADRLARTGSRFWIVRPHLSLDSVQGLETIIGARYLEVLPGPEGGEPQAEFIALEEPPIAERIDPEGLEITLESKWRLGLAPGAPLGYRRIQIGSVLSVGLSSDATSVEYRVYVRPPFVQLVREKSRFWDVGGLAINLGMGGLEIEIDSLRSLLVGGIALATPPAGGEPVSTGHRFALHAEPEDEWLEWQPPLPVGSALLPIGTTLPRPLRAQVSWKKGLLRTTARRQGWVLLTSEGLLGPADLLKASEDARAGSAVLELAGQRFDLSLDPVWEGRGLARVRIGIEDASEWPSELVRSASAAEDCLVVADPAAPIALSAARLLPDPNGWRVDGALAFDPEWHGACVVARSDGRLVGILLIGDGGAVIARPPD